MMIWRFATMTGTPSRVVCWIARGGSLAAQSARDQRKGKKTRGKHAHL
jgi:hypothetical protein